MGSAKCPDFGLTWIWDIRQGWCWTLRITWADKRCQDRNITGDAPRGNLWWILVVCFGWDGLLLWVDRFGVLCSDGAGLRAFSTIGNIPSARLGLTWIWEAHHHHYACIFDRTKTKPRPMLVSAARRGKWIFCPQRQTIHYSVTWTNPQTLNQSYDQVNL